MTSESAGICFMDAIDIYTLDLDGKPVLAFPAQNRRVVDHRMKTLGGIEGLLRCLVSDDGEFLWDGDRSRLHARGATEEEVKEWKRVVRNVLKKSPDQPVDVVLLVPAPQFPEDSVITVAPGPTPVPTDVTYH